jgi:tetratricopeptide (TPR) repeat protein
MARSKRYVNSAAARTRVDIAIEFLTLTGLVLIPLVFRGREWVAFYSQPKFFVLHFIALTISVLWILEQALLASRSRTQWTHSLFGLVHDWLSQALHRWTLVAVAGFGFAFIVSTLLSPTPWVSVWGRDFGDLGYELYSTLSYLVIFFAIALRTRTQDQAIRVALVIAAVGTFLAAYGMSQTFGWDPIGQGENLSRVIASFGNPLYFGSYLVMSIPIVMALALYLDSKGRSWVLVPAVLSLGLHFAALWNTGGRGPWIASMAGLITFVVFTVLWLGMFRLMIKMVAIGLAGGAIALIITIIPGGTTEKGRGLEDLRGVVSELADGVQYIFQGSGSLGTFGPTARLVSGEPVSTSTTATASDVSSGLPASEDGVSESTTATASDVSSGLPASEDGVSDSGLGTSSPAGRLPALTLADAAQFEVFGVQNPQSTAIGDRADIWSGAFKLVATRDRVEEESDLIRSLRFMFGYGPDMYFYSYPITSKPWPELVTTSHAHNYPLQVLLEEGLVGFLLFMATAILVLVTGISVIRRASRHNDEDQWRSVLTVGLIAALVARAVEQGSGVGRISDLVTFWALMGLVVAVAEIGTGPSSPTRKANRFSLSTSGFQRLVPFGVVVTAGVIALTVFIQKDINQLRAGVISANGFEQKNASENDKAFKSFQDAISLAPDVERYYTEAAGFLIRTAAASVEDDPDRARELYTAAYELLLEFEDRDPFAWQTQLGIAWATSGLVAMGDDALAPELLGRYRNISALMSPFASIQAMVAENIVLMGEYEIGVNFAKGAIALEGPTTSLPTAWWALGEAMFQLDRLDDAELAWQTSVKRQDRGIHAARSLRGLAFINEKRGYTESAVYFHERADGLAAELR